MMCLMILDGAARCHVSMDYFRYAILQKDGKLNVIVCSEDLREHADAVCEAGGRAMTE